MTDVFLEIGDIRDVCHKLAVTKFGFDEPIDPFETRYPNRLESALSAPQTSFGGEYLYETFEQRAAVLFYELIKQHPFVNGNKRIAVVSLNVFLLLNDRYLLLSNKQLYDIALATAKSQKASRDVILCDLSSFLPKHIHEYVLNRAEPNTG